MHTIKCLLIGSKLDMGAVCNTVDVHIAETAEHT